MVAVVKGREMDMDMGGTLKLGGWMESAQDGGKDGARGGRGSPGLASWG